MPRHARRAALGAVADRLRCPHCGKPLTIRPGRLGCPGGHSFDIARHGYVDLTAGRLDRGTADSADMVAARARFLSGGHFNRITAAVQASVAEHDGGDDGLVIDLACGTSHHLGAVLDGLPHRWGVGFDLSRPAARRAAAAHPRAAAVVADVWRPLPLAPDSAAVVLSIFGPRNPVEVTRVLVPGGVLIVVSPLAQHLREIVAPLNMLRVDSRKAERQASALRHFHHLDSHEINYQLQLGHDEVTTLVTMGPTARHISQAELTKRVTSLPDPTMITIAVQVTAYHRPIDHRRASARPPAS